MCKFSEFIKIKLKDDDEIKEENCLEYKILVLGDKFVGKSSICLRFAMDEFNLEIKPSIQCECYSRTLDVFGGKVRIYLIDVHQKYEEFPNEFKKFLFEDLSGIILVYDVTKTKSLDSIGKKWANDLKTPNFPKVKVPVMLLGNKADLKFLRNIDSNEGKEKAQQLNYDFFETDCVSENSVKDSIKFLIARIYYESLSKDKKDMYRKKVEEDEKKKEQDEKSKIN